MSEKDKIVLSDFLELKWQAYKDNSSFTKTYVSYKDCLNDIKRNNWDGYKPELGWQKGTGDYDKNYNSLIPVLEKIEFLNYSTTLSYIGGLGHILKILSGGVDIPIVARVKDTKIEAICDSCIKFINWYKSLKS